MTRDQEEAARTSPASPWLPSPLSENQPTTGKCHCDFLLTWLFSFRQGTLTSNWYILSGTLREHHRNKSEVPSSVCAVPYFPNATPPQGRVHPAPSLVPNQSRWKLNRCLSNDKLGVTQKKWPCFVGCYQEHEGKRKLFFLPWETCQMFCLL